MAKKKAAEKKPPTKSEIMSQLAEKADITKKQATTVVEELMNLAGKNLKKSGPGSFSIPGYLKFTVQRKPATKARKGVNPFTGEEIMIKAKPARNVVKVRPLKKIKDMV